MPPADVARHGWCLEKILEFPASRTFIMGGASKVLCEPNAVENQNSRYSITAQSLAQEFRWETSALCLIFLWSTSLISYSLSHIFNDLFACLIFHFTCVSVCFVLTFSLLLFIYFLRSLILLKQKIIISNFACLVYHIFQMISLILYFVTNKI